MKSMVLGCRKLSPFLAEDLRRARPAYFRKNIFKNFGRRMARIDKELRNPLIRIAEQQQTARRFTVTSGTADLLVISLDGIRNIGMDDEPYIAAIDAHPKSIGGNDDACRRFHEFLLHGFALR